MGLSEALVVCTRKQKNIKNKFVLVGSFLGSSGLSYSSASQVSLIEHLHVGWLSYLAVLDSGESLLGAFDRFLFFIAKEGDDVDSCYIVIQVPDFSSKNKGIYILVRLLILHSSFTWKHWIGLFVTSVAYALPYLQLSNMAQPSYDENGELLDGGFDMSTGGICGYLHDLIYITSFVQLGSIISDKFWYAYLVIPAFAAYKLYDISKGWFGSSAEEPEDEKARRKREKMERKSSRTKYVRSKNR